MNVVVIVIKVNETPGHFSSGWHLHQSQHFGATQNEYTAWTIENPRRFSAMSMASMEEAAAMVEEVVRDGRYNYDDCGHRNPDLVDLGPRKSFAISLEDEVKMDKDEKIPKIAAMVVHLDRNVIDQEIEPGDYMAYLVANPDMKVTAETEEEAVRKLNKLVRQHPRECSSRKIFTISFENEFVSEIMEG